jgi:hypothetical protein
LRERGGDLTPESVRALTLLSTGSQEAADDAWARAYDAQLRRENNA